METVIGKRLEKPGNDLFLRARLRVELPAGFVDGELPWPVRVVAGLEELLERLTEFGVVGPVERRVLAVGIIVLLDDLGQRLPDEFGAALILVVGDFVEGVDIDVAGVEGDARGVLLEPVAHLATSLRTVRMITSVITW
jgi:hypothetical protein